MVQTISRGQMGVLDKLGQGGQGVVYRAPSVRSTYAKSMVFKEYKPGTLASLNVAALEAMPEFLESLPYRDGANLISTASWPCAVVDDGGDITGFVMPSIPDEFFTDFRTAMGPSRVAAEFQHLLNDPHVLAMRFPSGVISDRQRYELLQQVASALKFLHDRGVCVGDISPKNLLFSLSPTPAIYFVDCDAMRVNGVSLANQMETPGWQIPAGEEMATTSSDRYKLGLLALRLLVGSQDAKDPGRLPPATPVSLQHVIADTLNSAPGQRPSLDQWDAVLKEAIATAPVSPPPPPPPPPPSAPVTAPTPIVVITPPSNPGLPPPPPPTPPPPPGGATNRNTWLLVAGGLLLGAVLLFINNGPPQSPTPSPATTTRSFPDPPTNTMSPDGPVTLPANAVFCGQRGGVSYTRAARGTTITSCPFAESVRDAVNSSGGGFPRTVRAYSPVTNRYYDMDCVGGNPVVTCTGGNDAVVYVY